MKYIALILLVLVGCGGGGDEPTGPCRVQLFGDSTMVNLAAFTTDSNGKTALERALPDIKFSLRAVAGTDTQQLIDGTDGLNKPWPGSLDADLIVVNHGLNDVRNGVTLDAYRANLLAIGRSVPTVFMTPNFASGRDVRAYAQIMREVAATLHAPLVDVFAATDGVESPDGIHPAPEAEQRIADLVAPAIGVSCP